MKKSDILFVIFSILLIIESYIITDYLGWSFWLFNGSSGGLIMPSFVLICLFQLIIGLIIAGFIDWIRIRRHCA